jgi:hypothetical protein
MSAIDVFLASPAHPDPTEASDARTRHLRSADGIVVQLTTDLRDEDLRLVSRPGHVDQPELYDNGTQTWSHTVPHPRFEGVQCSLVIDTNTGELFLVDGWRRTALAPEQRAAFLEDHAERHRAWLDLLAAPEHDDDDLEDDDEWDDENGLPDSSGSSDALPFRFLKTRA